MANLYKDADKRRKVTPGGAQPPQDEPKVVETITVAPEPEKPVETPAEPIATDFADLVDQAIIVKKAKPKKRTRSLYLSDDVYNELVKRGRKQGMSQSDYLDTLLKSVFGL